ncbi:ATP-binding cassette domain-containing protein [Rhizobium lusitanum]|uniref:ATP-binding cassette domain-containing protein n=1 Tax=Rhizobium lusitanum TaxID=293958 RepID=A0A6L9UEM9_9HYPH|nr:sugar ABC transporter ATP-binding protein [Rhizobium lusitanum]NEI72576.1 ATP-binding cassette domain-containing protein [Rhizobium lusitanum]
MNAITIEAIDKRYGATHALRAVSTSCRAGDVQAIAGENGAGKSTLVKIISGVIPFGEYEGTFVLDGQPARFSSVRDAESAGVFLVPQELNVVPEMAVADYLFLNREPRRFGLVDRSRVLSETARWLATFQLDISPLAKMGDLRSHEQQLVSIARAMTQGVKILILDEPTASLTERETEILFERMRAFRELGVTTLYISHRLAEFKRIADAVTVMRDGQVVDDFRIDEEDDVPQRVVRTMVGRDLDELYPKSGRNIGEPLFEVSNWSVANLVANKRPLVEDVTLSIRSGEVVGIFGLIGSGASDFAQSLFGASMGRVTGHAKIRGNQIRLANPRQAMASGMAYLPSDRKRDGLFLDMSIASNLTLASLRQVSPRGILDRRHELSLTQERVRSLKVKCRSIEQPIGDLSGGNQQKIAVAKWMLAEPDLIVVEEPTRGVDVGARLEIYKLINSMAEQGKAVLIVSTDLAEILGMSDRVLAFHDGQIVGEWSRGQASEKDVMIKAAGSNKEFSQ